MRAQDEIRQLMFMDLRSPSILCFPKSAWSSHMRLKIIVFDKNEPFWNNACRCKNKKQPAASLKRRKWGLGLPIHLKMTFIMINMPLIATHIDEYTLLVLNRAPRGEGGGDISVSMFWKSDLHALDSASLCLEYRISMPRISDLHALNIEYLGIECRISMLRISNVYARTTYTWTHPWRTSQKIKIDEIDISQMDFECHDRYESNPNIQVE